MDSSEWKGVQEEEEEEEEDDDDDREDLRANKKERERERGPNDKTGLTKREKAIALSIKADGSGRYAWWWEAAHQIADHSAAAQVHETRRERERKESGKTTTLAAQYSNAMRFHADGQLSKEVSQVISAKRGHGGVT